MKRTKTEKAIGFSDYVYERLVKMETARSLENSLAVVKASEKSGYNKNYPEIAIKALKKKYPTLQDVYIREDV